MNLCARNEGANLPSSSKSAGFPKRARLLRHADFERVYKQGRRHFAAHMTIFYLPRTQGHGLRTGFTVGRALGGAVQRNRMKRRLREAVRQYRMRVTAGADVVINPKKSLLKAEFTEVVQQVERAFRMIQQRLETEAPIGEQKC